MKISNGHKRLTFETAQKLKQADASDRLGLLDMIEGNRAQMASRSVRRDRYGARPRPPHEPSCDHPGT